VKRSLLDPLPRPISTPALVALVALVVCGTGVAVMRFLETAPGAARRSHGTVHAAPEGGAAPAPETRRDTWRAPARPITRGTLSAGGGTLRSDIRPSETTTGMSEAQTRSIPCSAAETAPTLARPLSVGS